MAWFRLQETGRGCRAIASERAAAVRVVVVCGVWYLDAVALVLVSPPGPALLALAEAAVAVDDRPKPHGQQHHHWPPDIDMSVRIHRRQRLQEGLRLELDGVRRKRVCVWLCAGSTTAGLPQTRAMCFYLCTIFYLPHYLLLPYGKERAYDWLTTYEGGHDGGLPELAAPVHRRVPVAVEDSRQPHMGQRRQRAA